VKSEKPIKWLKPTKAEAKIIEAERMSICELQFHRCRITCERCPKWRRDLGGLCVHYATTFPPYHPLCKYGKGFIHNEQSRKAMAKMRAKRKATEE